MTDLTRNRRQRVRVFPYLNGSQSAKKLAQGLGGLRLRRTGSRFRPRRSDVIVNWGSSVLPDFGEATVVNRNIAAVANKLNAFEVLKDKGVSIPPFATDREGAAERLSFPVVCRTKLTGHSGDGIVIATTPEELVNAPLYTQYVKKKHEFRVHVTAQNGVFFTQRKARRLEVEDPDWRVRNLANGFVFVSVPVEEVPDGVLTEAVAAVNAFEGVDFGGVDVIWNEHEQKAYVLEVNTAVGLEDRTAEYYCQALKEIFTT